MLWWLFFLCIKPFEGKLVPALFLSWVPVGPGRLDKQHFVCSNVFNPAKNFVDISLWLTWPTWFYRLYLIRASQSLSWSLVWPKKKKNWMSRQVTNTQQWMLIHVTSAHEDSNGQLKKSRTQKLPDTSITQNPVPPPPPPPPKFCINSTKSHIIILESSRVSKLGRF